jgi:hypothetical protein
MLTQLAAATAANGTYLCNHTHHQYCNSPSNEQVKTQK